MLVTKTYIPTCDMCDQPCDDGEVLHFTRRPSDPADLCAILGECVACAISHGWDPNAPLPADKVPYFTTMRKALLWVEDHGHEVTPPILWVS